MTVTLPEDQRATLREDARFHRYSSRLNILGLLLLDFVLMTVAANLAMIGRGHVTIFDALGDIDSLLRPVPLTIAAAWLLGIAIAGGYSAKRLGSGTSEYMRVFNASLIVAGVVGMSAYLFQYPLSRGFFFLLFVIGIPLVLVGRFVFRRFVQHARANGRLLTTVLVAGDTDHIADIVTVLDRERWLGYQVIGALVSDADDDAESVDGLRVYGKPADAVDALRETGAGAVIFTEGSFRGGRFFNRLARDLEDLHAQIIVVPALTDISAQRMRVRPVAGMPLVHVESPRAQKARKWFKRAFDLVGSSLLILASAPIMLAVAIAIKATDGGPVFFRQVRAGLKGEPFSCLKFRSMVVDAEARLAELQTQNEGAGVLFKMTDDPRITRIGKFIRRFSIDEIPQFFCVFKGNMSLIGPRPALLSEVSRYESHVLRRLDVRPGITGLWQVSGRSDLSWDDTVRLDLYYVDNWSMMQDLAILGRTAGAVFGKRGAY